MDFARKQLEKYGWSDGKGLGKHENGIAQALKPKLKRSVTGIGHDPASEFNEHWWTALYNKAAENVEIKDKNGKTKKIKTKNNDGVVITTSTWKMNRKENDNKEDRYKDNFIRTAVLSGDGGKMENVKESDSEEEVPEKKDILKMTDEELFAACGGRTAHKGARHGLKATGKLARIAQQEQMLLTQDQYSGYSHAKKNKEAIIEEVNENDEVIEKKKKKKKRKHCLSHEEKMLAESGKPLPELELRIASVDVANGVTDEKYSCKSKNNNVSIKVEPVISKKKKRKFKDHEIETDIISQSNDELNSKVKKKKKKSKDAVIE